MSEKISVEVSSIRLEEETETPIMLLQKPNTNQVLPIWIGTIEAVSIAYAQEGFVHPRPQTHDLLINILESLNAKILEVSITDIHDKTYFAEIKLSTHEGELTLSSRPSDAIALALRSSAEIFVENSVFNDNFIEIYDENNVDIEEFSQFIDNVSPEDFS
jgi:bifunctional DNase/RNase